MMAAPAPEEMRFAHRANLLQSGAAFYVGRPSKPAIRRTRASSSTSLHRMFEGERTRADEVELLASRNPDGQASGTPRTSCTATGVGRGGPRAQGVRAPVIGRGGLYDGPRGVHPPTGSLGPAGDFSAERDRAMAWAHTAGRLPLSPSPWRNAEGGRLSDENPDRSASPASICMFPSTRHHLIESKKTQTRLSRHFPFVFTDTSRSVNAGVWGGRGPQRHEKVTWGGARA